MGHEDRGRLQALVQFLDLGAHLKPKLGIEIRQGLVKEEHPGVAHDGPAHGDPLTLASR